MWFESTHVPFLLAGMLVWGFDPVIFVPPGSMRYRRKNLTMCSAVCAKHIGHQLPRCLTLMLQCLTKEAFGGLSVSTFRYQNIDDVPILVHRPPQVVAFALDSDKHFINVPDIAEPSLFPAKRSIIDRSELDASVSDRFIWDGNTALGNQVFDIAKTERESMVEPDGMTDDFRRKPVTFIVGFHPPIVAQFSLTWQYQRDFNKGFLIAERIESGVVHIKDQTVHDEPRVPFGGVRDSGWGRFGGRAGLEEFTELRWISMQRSQRRYPF
jgi:hypothetical protein